MTLVSTKTVISYLLPSGERIEETAPHATMLDLGLRWRRETGETVLVPWSRVLLVVIDEAHVIGYDEMEALATA